eukprot:CAMPEP_0198115044 /NCGR_PEP_ID=MMETSP1442-20131203/6256_1 /TAXON_ID= /ORGANISM="Craspedostauros australis, Strain CCMP3328" /LENGTH=34 /DNA_ID= /DNA_START= /DNA_END= /DNA_ORIENTATION=
METQKAGGKDGSTDGNQPQMQNKTESAMAIRTYR